MKQSFTVFVPSSSGSASGTMYTGSYVASLSGGTWSGPSVPEQFAYTIVGDQLVTDGGGGPRSQSVTCTTQQLVLGEISLKTRAPSNESEGLRERVLDGGTWTGLPLP